MVQEITVASVEQNSSVNQINNAIQQMNDIVQTNANTAGELSKNSEGLKEQADLMSDIMSFF